jgi:hypothetical protein
MKGCLYNRTGRLYNRTSRPSISYFKGLVGIFRLAILAVMYTGAYIFTLPYHHPTSILQLSSAGTDTESYTDNLGAIIRLLAFAAPSREWGGGDSSAKTV